MKNWVFLLVLFFCSACLAVHIEPHEIDWTNASEDFLTSGSVSTSGNMYCSIFFGYGDPDTYINFFSDGYHFQAGGIMMMKFQESMTDYIAVNPDGDDINFIVDTNALFVDGGTKRVGIGTNAPAVKLHVVGDATATGALVVGSSDGETITDNTIDEDSIDWGTGTDQVSATDMPDFGTMTATIGNILVGDGTDFETKVIMSHENACVFYENEIVTY